MSDFLIIIVLTMLYLAVTGMLSTYVKILATQGVLLFLISISEAEKINAGIFLFIALETLFLKAMIIPWFLSKTIKKNEIAREIEPYIPHFYSLIIMSVIYSFGFFLTIIAISYKNVSPLFFGISMATILAGLFIIISRKKLITHLMGYMIIENGTFLLSLAVAKEMPLIVSLGVSLDIFIGLLLGGIFINRIRSTFDEHNIDALSNLKD